jgi:hypothetical protein
MHGSMGVSRSKIREKQQPESQFGGLGVSRQLEMVKCYRVQKISRLIGEFSAGLI